MCGIGGWLGVVPDSSQVIESMLHRLRHRGPDAHGVKTWDDAALVHTRLSIIDLAPSGAQPMSNEDGTIWVIFNGEIYNHHELRQQLISKGHSFRGRSDTEILPHLYEEEGIDFIHKPRGMFAFAIFDTRKKRLILARDRFGIKPLFYTSKPDYFGFASEIRALRVLPDIDATANLQAVADFAALFYVPAPNTYFRDISVLLPGEMLDIQLNSEKLLCKRWKYHQWELNPDYSLTMESAVKRAEELCAIAVKRQLESDVPLGAMLSGGIDSSLVCASAQELLADQLDTYNVRFADAEYDETWAAIAVAEHIGSKHHVLDMESGQGSWNRVNDLLAHVGQPFADTSLFAVDGVANALRKHVTVALAGDGGDEGFGGYKPYGRVRNMARLQRLPLWLWKSLGIGVSWGLQAASQINMAPHHLSARVSDLVESNDNSYLVQKMFCVLPDEEHRSLIRSINVDPIHRLFEPQFAGSKHSASRAEQLSAHITEASLRIEMPNDFLFKTDIASMHRSLEIRVPMLDEDLFEFGLSLPHHLKVSHGQTKAVLRQVATRHLPVTVAQKPKHGFSIPVDTWVNKEFKTCLSDTLLGPGSTLPDFFDPVYYRPIIEAFANGSIQTGVSRSLVYRRAIMLLSLHIIASDN